MVIPSLMNSNCISSSCFKGELGIDSTIACLLTPQSYFNSIVCAGRVDIATTLRRLLFRA
jgi:hypothetical protein